MKKINYPDNIKKLLNYYVKNNLPYIKLKGFLDEDYDPRNLHNQEYQDKNLAHHITGYSKFLAISNHSIYKKTDDDYIGFHLYRGYDNYVRFRYTNYTDGGRIEYCIGDIYQGDYIQDTGILEDKDIKYINKFISLIDIK